MDELLVCHLGQVEYRAATDLQERLRERRRHDDIGDVLLLLEHPPVYTRGRRTQDGELPMGAAWYATQGIDIVDTPRGGRVTYHGPGQLVGYAIMRTDDVVGHVRAMERSIVSALSEEDIAARTRVEDGPDFTGVWVGERKIASIGVHSSRGVTAHGFAVNVDNDLQPFEWIVPCGLHAQMTSICRELRSARAGGNGLPCFRKRMAYAFTQEHGRRQRLVSRERLLARERSIA
ncbi:MAG TPA: lipoyl(octanoyl) transferase LipB [Thermoleophilaceae bacterium]|jgi:lipoyl(octanoyl) transferase|nr:lipoyl(octanoyl) transferase LipB [Thermoleophilaceae bacterium]